jgi:L,D-peptidoglycan transpeptidase YkuD (ErfK/YbiS/YcfS/YnhG family)
MTRRIMVRPSAGTPTRGLLVAGPLVVPCALGRGGLTADKREGDGATPAAALRLVACHYRADRLPRPATRLPPLPIRPDDGWCDDPADRAYNRPVQLPYPAGHERMWRDDHLYDVVVVLDWNLDRPIPGRGSAIFFHLAAPGFAPTAGCVAVTLPAMRRILAVSGPGMVMDVGWS